MKMLSFNNRLNNLVLVKIGDTIGMSKHGDTPGTPSDDALTNFINSQSARYREPVKDIDTNFRWYVYPILCSPFLKNTDYKIYEKFLKNNNQPVVFILLGYGAGNLPFDEDKGYTLMTFVKEVVKENMLILTLHVQMEIPDLDYEVFVEFIKAGALFGCDMSLAEIMIKSAYLLGHYNPYNGDKLDYLKSAIMFGVGFRSRTSRRRYLGFINELPDEYKYIIPDKDYFQQLPYGNTREQLRKLM
jgi:hypothetical protein